MIFVYCGLSFILGIGCFIAVLEFLAWKWPVKRCNWSCEAPPTLTCPKCGRMYCNAHALFGLRELGEPCFRCTNEKNDAYKRAYGG